ncbi:MAG: hypothetical protein MUC77_03790 [Chromatiaceae bacterium]|jgi:hypothetical protein|nr:hypothetical protein [Chromatiaceae bacterium]
MILKAIVDDQEYSLNVPDALLIEGEDFFAKLDRDMDAGWQMSREWVSSPNRLERCQIVADKLLTALETENEKLGLLAAGYILSRMPGVESVELDVQGEIQNNQFHLREAAPTREAEQGEVAGGGLGKLAAMEQAGNDVTKVFRVGKGYRFSVYDHACDEWQDSPLVASREEAELLRQQAFKARFEALQKGGN